MRLRTRCHAGGTVTSSRGAMEGASGGGHAASDVIPRGVPVGGAKFVRAHPRVSHGPTGPRVGHLGQLRVVDRVVASIASLPRLGFDRSMMKRHDDSQRSGAPG